MTEAEQELYVGYLPTAPPGIAIFTRTRVASLLLIVFTLAAVLAFAQMAFSGAVFEYRTSRVFEGWIEERPYPTLIVARPRETSVSRYLLSSVGKHGAEAAVAGLEGKRVKLSGALIYRDDQTMIELSAAPIEVLDEHGEARTDFELPGEGVQTLVGEIVDSKCFLGAMKPGSTKPHRACATRCISGGIPPVFVVRDATGEATYYLLTSADGGPVGRELVELELIAEPLRITGEVLRYGDNLVLRSDPMNYERLE